MSTSWTFETAVDATGRIEIIAPLPPLALVTVLVTPRGDEFAGLTEAAQSSVEFWDNALDDEDWNDAAPG